MMADEIADDDFERQFELRRTDPAKFLELMNKLVERRPDDANAYFSRHQAWIVSITSVASPWCRQVGAV